MSKLIDCDGDDGDIDIGNLRTCSRITEPKAILILELLGGRARRVLTLRCHCFAWFMFGFAFGFAYRDTQMDEQ